MLNHSRQACIRNINLNTNCMPGENYMIFLQKKEVFLSLMINLKHILEYKVKIRRITQYIM